MKPLIFNPQWLQRQTVMVNGQPLAYAAATGISYVQNPVAPIQRLNVFVPNAYLDGQTVNGYDATSAPIFMPNTVGGYLPGPADAPDKTSWPTNGKAIIAALKHGYVVVAAGLRGRTTVSDGREVGHAPAFIVDMKAAIRYVRHNAQRLPGNVERIVTNGTSAGGATSALVGASGNANGFAPYLTALGAADERDDVFAVSAYCPIHNLQHADMAYEWQFNGVNDWHRYAMSPIAGQRPHFTPIAGELTARQQRASTALKAAFIDYLNGLQLTDATGRPLTLDAAGHGSFERALAELIRQSAQTAASAGTDVHKYAGITTEAAGVTGVDFAAYVRSLTRMKAVPAFDSFDLDSAENNLFGDETVSAKHFTAFAQAHGAVRGPQAAAPLVALIDPVSQLQTDRTTVAKHWRIRHGAADRDTSFAIPFILATSLQQRGLDVDLAFPWDVPHSGDYDLGDLFEWIDARCR